MNTLKNHITELLRYFIRPEILIVIIGVLVTGLVVLFAAANFGVQGRADATTSDTPLGFTRASTLEDHSRLTTSAVMDSLNTGSENREVGSRVALGSN